MKNVVHLVEHDILVGLMKARKHQRKPTGMHQPCDADAGEQAPGP